MMAESIKGLKQGSGTLQIPLVLRNKDTVVVRHFFPAKQSRRKIYLTFFQVKRKKGSRAVLAWDRQKQSWHNYVKFNFNHDGKLHLLMKNVLQSCGKCSGDLAEKSIKTFIQKNLLSQRIEKLK